MWRLKAKLIFAKIMARKNNKTIKGKGALPNQLIRDMISKGFIDKVEEKNIRPGSFDPSLTKEGYRVNGAFLPSYTETVKQALFRAGATPLNNNPILEKGGCYVFRLRTKINKLPDNVYAYCNPKSSSGRIDIHVRLLADKVSRYDYIPASYSGSLWLMILPKTFSVIISPGISLNQIRFCNQDTRFDESKLKLNFNLTGGLIFDDFGKPTKYKNIRHTDKDGSILLTLGLNNFSIPGYEALENRDPIDLTKINHYNPKEFFRPVTISDNSINFRGNTFYILSTKEFVRIPPQFACEMRPMDDRAGDFRSHYAGFVDPRWGCGKDNTERGRPLTLEIRSFENSLIVKDGQPISKIRLEKMVEVPKQHYDQMSPTYGKQSGPKLGKYFKEWK